MLNRVFAMSTKEFDAIIDDCFLAGAARSMTRKYKDRVNPRADLIIAEILEKEGGDFKVA